MQMKYQMPTRVVMGTGCLVKNAEELAPLGDKALIVTGSSSARASGALDDAIAALTKNGQGFAVYDKIPANPGTGCLAEGASVARMNGCDFVLAIGGGSPMDAGKAIALVAGENVPIPELFCGKYGDSILPIACVPTTAGTGSEATQYAIITNDAAETKTGIAAPGLFPRVAFLDATYMKTASRNTMVNTVIDSLSHSIEGIISNRAGPLTDALAHEALSIIGAAFPALTANTLSDGDRDRLLYASTLGGMVIANTGTTALHAMGYPLTYSRDIDHGRANGLILADFLAFVQKTRPDLVQKVLEPMKMNSLASLCFTLARLLGKPDAMTDAELEKYSAKAITAKNIANSAVVPTERDVLAIYRDSFSRSGQTTGLANSRHATIEFIACEDYLPAKHFRTVPPRLKDVPFGKTEIPVMIELSPKLASEMSFPVTWDGKVFGYVHDNERLASIFTGDMAKGYDSRRIYLNDWGDAFLLTFENGTRDREITRFVHTREIQSLFARCNILPENVYEM
jgi:alcohol dehydrogenase class IV